MTTKDGGARERRRRGGADRGGDGARTARAAGGQPAVRLRLGRDRPHDDAGRAGGEAPPGRRGRPAGLGVAAALRDCPRRGLSRRKPQRAQPSGSDTFGVRHYDAPPYHDEGLVVEPEPAVLLQDVLRRLEVRAVLEQRVRAARPRSG